jgi:hypothetical protein
MMTAEQVRDVILAETQSGMTTKQIDDFLVRRFGSGVDVDADTMHDGLQLAVGIRRRQAEQRYAEADRLERWRACFSRDDDDD